MFHINVPPLRTRTDDILPLTHHFLKIHAERNGKIINSIDPEFIRCLIAYSFPGNVRELENIIAKAVLLENEHILTPSSIRELIPSCPPLRRKKDVMTLEEAEKMHILNALELTNGNRTQAAKLLGIGLRTLQRKLKEWSGE